MMFTDEGQFSLSVCHSERLKRCFLSQYYSVRCSRWASSTGRSSYVAKLAALFECQPWKERVPVWIFVCVGVLAGVCEEDLESVCVCVCVCVNSCMSVCLERKIFRHVQNYCVSVHKKWESDKEEGV